jgi:DNA-binding MarR family transcriptional regulator
MAAKRSRVDPELAVRGLVRLSRVAENVLAEHQLSLAQFRILDRLASGSVGGKSLAEWLAVKPPSVTAVVDGLVKRGLVERSGDGPDRRQVSHAVTAEGVRVHRLASDRLGGRLIELAEHLGDEGQAAGLLAALAGWNPAIDAAVAAKRAGVAAAGDR